jgi:mannose-6-phosphate isomerase-like protein (cupin superfamily)
MTQPPVSANSIIRIGEIEIRYLMDGTRSGESGLFEMRLPPQACVPPAHSHAEVEEMLFVLEGTLRHTLDGVVRDLGPGDTAFTPRGGVQGFSNPFNETVRTLTVLTPDIGEQYIRALASIVIHTGVAPAPVLAVETRKRNELEPVRM